LFGLEDLDRLPWQCLSDPTVVEEPFPFVFVEGEDPIRSANRLYAQRLLKRNDLVESPMKVFLDGHVRHIAVDEVLALLNAASSASLEGDLLRLEQ
jgi:DNA polymerase-1